MTVRDAIYKQYQEGGNAYATLGEGLHPQFVPFIEKQTFQVKNVLDIGCGNGKYLVYLKCLGFDITGIDSSPTAVDMTKEAIGNEGAISCHDMYTMEIPPDTFDLIISTNTIHHGKKQGIIELIHKICIALSKGGKIFITLPSNENSNHRNSFKDKQEIAPGTFIPLSGPEKGLPHSFFSQEEVQGIFSRFQNVNVILDTLGQWIITGEK